MKKTKEISFKVRLDYDIKDKELPSNVDELEKLFFQKVGTILQERNTVLGKVSTIVKDENKLNIFWETKLIK